MKSLKFTISLSGKRLATLQLIAREKTPAGLTKAAKKLLVASIDTTAKNLLDCLHSVNDHQEDES